jgi:hypothetical protein
MRIGRPKPQVRRECPLMTRTDLTAGRLFQADCVSSPEAALWQLSGGLTEGRPRVFRQCRAPLDARLRRSLIVLAVLNAEDEPLKPNS